MVDVVYILGTGSKWQNNELRYSLRSVAKHLNGFNNIYVVGERPDWLKDIIHISAQDVHKGRKEHNISHKVLIACSQLELSHDFLFMNDDHFLLKPADAGKFPYYHRGEIKQAYPTFNTRRNGYEGTMQNTYKVLQAAGLPTLHYDVHTPILYSKNLFPQAINAFTWLNPFGYGVKSLYANYFGFEGPEITDCKINHPLMQLDIMQLLKDRPCFSIGDHGINACMKNIMQWLYPDPSPWEIPS